LSTLSTPIEEFQVGPIQVVVRYGCVRRDQYELLTQSAFPRTLKPKLAELGQVRGSEVLYTVDVPATHQITVAPERGRMVIMPRLSVERALQRQSVLAVADLLAHLMAAESG
jgi:hypothetical protein